jgi:hypothetical protein
MNALYENVRHQYKTHDKSTIQAKLIVSNYWVGISQASQWEFKQNNMPTGTDAYSI